MEWREQVDAGIAAIADRLGERADVDHSAAGEGSWTIRPRNPAATVIVVSSNAGWQRSRLDRRTDRSVEGPWQDRVHVRLMREHGDAFDIGTQFDLSELRLIVDAVARGQLTVLKGTTWQRVTVRTKGHTADSFGDGLGCRPWSRARRSAQRIQPEPF